MRLSDKELKRLEVIRRAQELKEAYDKGYSQGYGEGVKEVKK